MHLIVNIGYTFGCQSTDIIRSLINLFARRINSLNIIGKAGGLIGSRGDILVATKIYSDESNDVVNNNLGKLNPEQLEKEAHTKVFVGPMLTVAGKRVE